MRRLIDSISHNVPAALIEVVTLGRTLTRRAGDILAYFDRPGTSNRPKEAINGRLEHLRGTALGFRNLTAPGLVVTPALQHHGTPADSLGRSQALYPMPRFCRPEDVAKAALFLASEDASYINGTTLMVDGWSYRAGPTCRPVTLMSGGRSTISDLTRPC
jgi:Enoyl-(Acyl carrier protein) reductase/Transposase